MDTGDHQSKRFEIKLRSPPLQHICLLMPITRDNWEMFFQGAFAEHHVCSLFYFYGYEVQKLSPDVGIDWMVTNVARARFNNEDSLNVEVQVKSALLDKTGAFVTMHSDEIDFLCIGEHCRGSIKTDTLIRSYPIHKERLNP